MVTHRPGFGLAEVVIAALLVAGGVLTMAAAGVAVRARVTAAAAEERALRLAALLVDSLRSVPNPAPAGTLRDGVRASWAVEGADIVITTTVPAGLQGESTRAYRVRSAAAVPQRQP